MKNSKEIKQQIETIETRIVNAEKFLTNDKISEAEKNKWKPAYLKLKKQRDKLIAEYKAIKSENFIQEYNSTLKQYYNAEKLLEEGNNSVLNEFYKLIKELSNKKKEYKYITGYEMNNEEVLNGFKI